MAGFGNKSRQLVYSFLMDAFGPGYIAYTWEFYGGHETSRKRFVLACGMLYENGGNLKTDSLEMMSRGRMSSTIIHL